jgi:hypothetical protein
MYWSCRDGYPSEVRYQGREANKTIQQTALEWQHIASTFYGGVMVSTCHLREHYVLYIT